MKITKRQLRRIIREEKRKLVTEQPSAGAPLDAREEQGLRAFGEALNIALLDVFEYGVYPEQVWSEIDKQKAEWEDEMVHQDPSEVR
tara:strand:- start:378 stop:638 length:261 start_codon:yes stop_codon:yes gene_type:complete